MNAKNLLLVLTFAGLAAPLAQAQLDITISGDIILGRRPPPPPPEVVVVVDDGPRTPPPWVRSRWYQRNQEYYYYPGYDVYYRPADRVWFYQDRGQWRNGRSLPPGYRVEFDRSITISMATDRPYQFHQQVVTRYPSNYFGTKVRLRHDDRRNDGDNRGRDRDHDGRDRDGDGRDRDRDDRRSDRDRNDDDKDKSRDRGRN